MVGTRSLAWLSLLAVLALAMLGGSLLPGAGVLESRGQDLVAPAGGALEALVRPAADAIHEAGKLHELTSENADLRQDLARAEAELAALREQQIRSAQVTELIDAVGGDLAAGAIAASVVLREPAPGRAAVLVDRGERDGVRVGQPVLGPGATLVGVVTQVEPSRARVRLLIDPDSAVTALVQSSREQGALAGTADGLRLELVPADAIVAKGDLVLSSALGGRLPAGLLIGRVSSVERSPQEPFATIEVEPLADFDRLEHVLVLTGREGASAAGAAP